MRKTTETLEGQVARRKSAAEKNDQSFYVHLTQGEVKETDGEVKARSDLDELLGMSTVSMDFDVSSVEGEAHLQAYMQVQQVPNDTDPLMCWKQHQQE